MTGTIEYSCASCGLKNAPVAVLTRQEEDVVYWLEAVVIPTVDADHRARSPQCRATRIDQLRIPLGAAGVARI